MYPMLISLLSDVSYKSLHTSHIIQFFGKTIAVIHELNSEQCAKCTLADDFIVTLDETGTTVYFESEDDFVKVVTMLNNFSENV